MTRDEMTPLERFGAYSRGEPIDRLPCVPIVGNTAARVIGVKVSDLKGNGKMIAKAQVAAYRLFGYDIIRIFTDLYTQAEAMGAKVFLWMKQHICLPLLYRTFRKLMTWSRQILIVTVICRSTWKG